MSLKFKAVIFDMDGVVVNTEETKYKSLIMLLKNYGINLKKDPKLLGMSSKDFFNVIKNKNKLNYKVDEMMKLREKLIFKLFKKQKINIMPGFLRLVKSLKNKNIKLGLATSSTNKFLKFILNKVNIKKYFDVIICGEDVKHSKPNPSIYLLTAKKLNVKPKDCIVIEDAVNGIKAAKSANMYVIAVTNTFPRKYLKEANIIVSSLKEIKL